MIASPLLPIDSSTTTRAASRSPARRPTRQLFATILFGTASILAVNAFSLRSELRPRIELAGPNLAPLRCGDESTSPVCNAARHAVEFILRTHERLA